MITQKTIPQGDVWINDELGYPENLGCNESGIKEILGDLLQKIGDEKGMLSIVSLANKYLPIAINKAQTPQDLVLFTATILLYISFYFEDNKQRGRSMEVKDMIVIENLDEMVKNGNPLAKELKELIKSETMLRSALEESHQLIYAVSKMIKQPKKQGGQDGKQA